MGMQAKASIVEGLTGITDSPSFPGEIRISCFDNEIPALAGPEIDRIYGHLFCSLSFLEMTKTLPGASTYVAQKSGRPVAVILYKQCRNEVTVLNDYAKLDEEEIQRFAQYIFKRFDAIKHISFSTLSNRIHNLAYPWHSIASGEDMVISLPPTVKAYEEAVGKNMRRNIKRYTSALLKDFPSYCYQVYFEGDISESHVQDIVALSCMRLKSKNVVPRFNEAETRWMVDYAKQRGIVGIAKIDGRVCAGAIGFHIGEKYFMYVIAHDLEYNKYSLGILCYYHTLCEGIARGAKEFHLLSGRYEYKYRLLAERQDVFHLDIFRNRIQYLAYASRTLKKEIRGRIRLLKLWLLNDIERHEGAGYRLIARLVNVARHAKRSR